MNDVSVKLTAVSKWYGEVLAVDTLSLEVSSGSFLTLLGPSGCGKTTTLRMIGGFEAPSAGEIFLMGKEVTVDTASRRKTNMVFQDYALFPHKTVGQNIGFGLKMRGVKKPEIEKRVREMLELIGLPDVYHRMPHQLSGGQQQRVALARALILKPPVLLLDEPLGALDAKIRKQLQIELKHLQRELGITFIYVTHDQEEAMTMSDVIGIMNGGRLEQLGTPSEIYERPRTLFVARFVGECNLFEGKVTGATASGMEIADRRGRIFRSPAAASHPAPAPEKGVFLMVRPEDMKVGKAAEGCPNRVEGRIAEKLYTGVAVRLMVKTDDSEILVDAPKGIDASPAERTLVGWNPDAGSIIFKD